MTTLDGLRAIATSIAPRCGWDFSRMHEDRDPVPWEYTDVVCRYLTQQSCVLDIGTGGGERFLTLAPSFGCGVGTDVSPSMIAVANENARAAQVLNITFAVMPAADLRFPAASFDVVLNRHAVVDAAEVARVLRPGGTFITQQVGSHNTANLCAIFGCGPSGAYVDDPSQSIDALAAALVACGCADFVRAEYDVPYFFADIKSLVFWLQALPMPEDFSFERHWRQVDDILRDFTTPRGIQTNEHRVLLIACRLSDVTP